LLVAVAPSDGRVFESLAGAPKAALERLAIRGALGEDAGTEGCVSVSGLVRGEGGRGLPRADRGGRGAGVLAHIRDAVVRQRVLEIPVGGVDGVEGILGVGEGQMRRGQGLTSTKDWHCLS
jgi:hypothetical protein